MRSAGWILLSSLIWLSSCTTPPSVSKQASQELKPADRAKYAEVDERWLATLRKDCKRPKQDHDDPEYPGQLPGHVQVSAASLGEILKACYREAKP
jgi:hypothetical protein